MSEMKRLALAISESNTVNYLPLQYFYTTSNESLIPRSQGAKFVFTPPCKIASFNFLRNRIELQIVKSPYGAGADTAPRSCITFSYVEDKDLMSSVDRDGLEIVVHAIG